MVCIAANSFSARKSRLITHDCGCRLAADNGLVVVVVVVTSSGCIRALWSKTLLSLIVDTGISTVDIFASVALYLSLMGEVVEMRLDVGKSSPTRWYVRACRPRSVAGGT